MLGEPQFEYVDEIERVEVLRKSIIKYSSDPNYSLLQFKILNYLINVNRHIQ